MTMKTIHGKLNANHFERIHRSFIVPINKIEAIKKNTVTIGEKKIPIGSTYETQFLKIMEIKYFSDVVSKTILK